MKIIDILLKPNRLPWLRVVFLLAVISVVAVAQDPTAADGNSNTAAATPTPAATPIPLSDINIQSEETKKQIEKIQNGLKKQQTIIAVETGYLSLKKDLDERTTETTRLLSARPSLETLRVAEQDWLAFAKMPPIWKADLKTRLTALETELKNLALLQEIWEKTRTSFQVEPSVEGNTSAQATKIPSVISETVNKNLNSIEVAKKLIEKRRLELLALQSKVGREESRITETLKAISDYRSEALTHLLVQDSPAIWNTQRKTTSAGSIFSEAGDSFSAQVAGLREYASAKRDQFIFHGVIFLFLAAFLFWARRRLKPLVDKEEELTPAFSAFELPIIGALILSMLLSGWLYEQAPRMLQSIIGATILVPGIIYLRKILEKHLFPILNALMVFYFIDLVKLITATLPLLTRMVFILEMLGAVVFLIWYLRSVRDDDGNEDDSHREVFLVIKKVAPVVLFLFAIALLASVLGFVSLSNVIGNSILASAYTALILYAAIQIAKSVFIFSLRVRPLSSLGMVKTHREIIKSKVFWLLKWAGIAIWLMLSLDFFSVRQSILDFLKDWLTTEMVIGSISISVSDVLLFGFTVWFAFTLSKLIRFVLNEDVYPRTEIPGGVSYAISTVLHYIILVTGFVIAVAAMGIDMTKFTILAGALGVGLGFGLQNIVNNFVSGLILLFERPVKVDDVIEINGQQGDLKRIGLRASVLRTLDGSEIIVPNGQLISEQVTNWTFSDQKRRIEVNVGVAYGSDPAQVIELLNSVVEENDDILDDPPARTIFVGFGDSSLDFQLRAWTMTADRWVQVRSALLLAVYAILNENNIEIPFPQRDLHVRSIDGKAAGHLKGSGNSDS